MWRALTASQRTRRLAAWASVFALSGSLLHAQFASLAHDLTVRHVICPEHGEVLDLALDAQDQHPPHRQPVLESAAPDRGHEHCQLGLLARLGTRQEPSFLAAPRAAEWGLLVTACPTPARASIALLRLAPKASPPASGRG